MLSAYKTILFDIDDTLLDFQKAQESAFRKLCQTVDLTYDVSYYQTYQVINHGYWQAYEKNQLTKEELLARRFADFFKAFGMSVDGKACDERYRRYLEEGDQLFPATLAVLDKYHQTHQLAIVTNGVEKTQLARLANNGLLNYFADCIFISDAIGHQKPDPAFFDHVFAKMPNLDKSSTVIVGDTFSADIKGGFDYGIATCWVNPKQLPVQNGMTPSHVISSLAELL